MFSFTVSKTSGTARLGAMRTSHGEVATPVFMPVGTAGSVKGVTPSQLRDAGAQMVLANTYHLLLRPGPDVVAALGGLHAMMAWNGPILTDSGGYQVFSLAHMRRLGDDSVVFQSHIDGSQVELTPALAIEVQQLLGADVIMQLDECPPVSASKEAVLSAVVRSARWAQRCKDAWLAPTPEVLAARAAAGMAEAPNPQALFGIQQGGLHADLRAQSAAELAALDLPGYAIGGLSVGEGHDAMVGILDGIDAQLPPHKPRYLMGVGEPKDIIAAVLRGVDMFDCVLPTRNGRNAQAFTWHGRLRLRNQKHARNRAPLDESCDCYACRNFSRGTLRHLFGAKEMLGPTLLTIHNLHFMSQLMAAIREAIAADELETRAKAWLAAMYADQDEGSDDAEE